jgi:acetyl-CoA carboxylase carboxyl transferase subunit alpha
LRKETPKSHKEWEKDLVALEEGITKLRELSRREPDPSKRANIESQAKEFEGRRDSYVKLLYSRLGPWERVLVARAEKRPYTLDYIGAIFTGFIELDGDRRGYRDHAIVGGIAKLDDRPVLIVGHQKGRTIQDRQYRNFGSAKPEGYRKAIRLFDLAERFRLPVITFVDTSAADPGVDSESRGISEAIAAGMHKMFELTVPAISIVIGEGGSGGAIGIATSNRVLMLENSTYSVIPPEGCAAILWRQPERAPDAAKALNLTAEAALEFKIIDEIIEEPLGGAHRDPMETANRVRTAILKHLGDLDELSPEQIREQRYQKYRDMGVFTSGVAEQLSSNGFSKVAVVQPAAEKQENERGGEEPAEHTT